MSSVTVELASAVFFSRSMKDLAEASKVNKTREEIFFALLRLGLTDSKQTEMSFAMLLGNCAATVNFPSQVLFFVDCKHSEGVSPPKKFTFNC